jgi:molybdopterin molybdotransferase
MAGVAASWRIIEVVLWQNVHSVYRALRKPATDRQIVRLARLVSAKLPRDFVQSLKIHDGLRDSYLGQNRLFDYYALMPVSAIMAEYKMIRDLEAQDPVGCSWAGAGADAGVRNDLRFRPGWLPFMDSDGDKLVLDLDPAPGGSYGQVFEWSSTGSTFIRILAPSFGEWLAGLAETLSKRRFGLDEFGEICLSEVPGTEPAPAATVAPARDSRSRGVKPIQPSPGR